jgi:hypothetical protein
MLRISSEELMPSRGDAIGQSWLAVSGIGELGEIRYSLFYPGGEEDYFPGQIDFPSVFFFLNDIL